MELEGKRRLFIIGASGFGRELESWLELIPEQSRDWKIAGYLDKNQSALESFPSDYEIVGEENSFEFLSSDYVILGIADPKIKHAIYEKLHKKVSFFTYIAPNATIGKFTQIDEGTVICPHAIVSTNVHLSICTTVNIGANIGHDVQVDSFSSLMPHVDLGGFVKIETGVFLGTKATVIPFKKVGKNAFVGAGSVVVHNVSENLRIFGNPASKIVK